MAKRTEQKIEMYMPVQISNQKKYPSVTKAEMEKIKGDKYVGKLYKFIKVQDSTVKINEPVKAKKIEAKKA